MFHYAQYYLQQHVSVQCMNKSMLFIYLTFSLHFKSLLLNSTTFLAYSVTNSKKCKHTQYEGPNIFKGNNNKTESRCHCNHFTIRHDLYRVEDF